ncbi:expressed unknown protein [Seminavis robusta]|uniref:Uncharacterized protein n=1 Tax=Seminavis robusta TaxID=568900 RepID=A0A9N8HE98_9STRA|nr:expressed unknown protein [Seminavis robusta]|eukprot:Sro294_g110270.1 n/a (261) ;mRNA; f:55411-56297
MRHNPTAEELELAVSEVLEKSDKDLTAKEVREKLLQENGKGWKVPAERRIAKFVKRQNSRKNLKDSGDDKKGLISRFFKGDSKTKSPARNKQQDAEKPEAHPDDTSMSTVENEKKGGLRNSFARVFSTRKSSSPKASEKEAEKSAEEVIPVAVAEAVETDKPTTNTVHQLPDVTNPPPATDDSPILKDPAQKEDCPKPPVATGHCGELGAEKSAESAVVANRKQEDKWMSHEVDVAKTFAYLDDNDGKRNDCDCELCIIQ